MEREKRKEIKDCPDGRWCVYSGWLEEKKLDQKSTKQKKNFEPEKKSAFGQ